MCTGPRHVAAGQVTALALAGVTIAGVPLLHVPPATAPLALLACTYMAGGAGTVNDLDHAHTTASDSLGPVTELLSHAVNKLSGGHRFATHNLAAPAAFAAVAWLAGLFRHTWPGAVVLCFYLVIILTSGTAFLAGSGGHRHLRTAGECMAVIAAVVMTGTGWGVGLVPVAVVLGTASHVVLDMLTKDGCHLFYPLTRRTFRLLPERLCFTTGEGVEKYGVQIALSLATVVLLYGVIMTDFPAAQHLLQAYR